MTKSGQQVQVRRYMWRVAEVTSLLLFVFIVTLVFVWALKYILPFVVGWFVAILLLPLVKSLEGRGVKKPAAALTVLIGILALVLILSTFAVVAIAREATLFLVNVPNYFTLLQTWLQHQIEVGKVFFGQLPPNVAQQMQTTAMHALSSLQNGFQRFAKFLLDSITKLPEISFIVAISLITAYFMLADRDRLYRGFMRILPPGWSGKLEVALNDMGRAFTGTIRVQVVLMLMTAVLGVIGMWILKIEYAVILGILFAITGMLPILGSAIMTIPWAAGALITGNISLAMKIILLQAVISAIRHVVEPKILADSVGLDTLSTLFALYVGMQLMGVLGLFLGPIILIGLKSLLRARLFVDFLPDHEESAEKQILLPGDDTK